MLDNYENISYRNKPVAGSDTIKMPMLPHPQRILCVDDDHDTYDLLRAVLSDYEVHSAETVREALDIIRDGPFRLIILDYLLPDGNGIDLCRRIRQWDTETSVIFVTGSGLLEPEDAVEAGAAGLVRKADTDFLDRILAAADTGTLPESELPTNF